MNGCYNNERKYIEFLISNILIWNGVVKMHDFKVKTGEALFTMLNIKQFSFESLNSGKKEKNQELFQQMAMHMPITEITNGIYYRARKINDFDGEETGIIRENGIPVTGYNVQFSGIAPSQEIKQNGRVNRIGEQVLYLAEDIETSCKEQKADENDYISVAECTINNNIKVMDFAITVSDGLFKLFSDEKVHFFKSNYSVDIRVFYIFIKEYLISPYYREQDYIIPLEFLDIVKRKSDISGIKYNSFYTDKCNIALWDENKNRKCINSKVVHGQV